VIDPATEQLALADDFNPETITDLIRHWAIATPDAPVLLSNAHTPLTYLGLAEVMAGIRQALNGWGYGRHDRIALIHSGGAEMAAALAGISGCATAVPLNPDKPISEFVLILRDARVKALAVEARMDTAACDAAARLKLPVIEIESVDPTGAGRIVLRARKNARRKAGPAEPGPARADDVAVLLETSGTSGHAKLVPIRHRQAMARGRRITAYLALTAADRCLSATPLFHVGGVMATL
jgi:acyl-CoA synthetase (AMP-forming)/AMP-acid ligase II